MNFKKTIAKSLVVAMALGMVPVANLQTAKAAATTVNFEGATGLAKAAGAKFWGIAKEDKANGKGSVKIGTKNYKISNIQEYTENVGIDAYAALKGKAGIIVAGEKSVPDADWGVLELPAAESTFKVYVAASTAAVKGFTPANKYGGEYGYLFASVGKQPKEVDLAASGEAVEVKLNEGNWQKVKEFFGGAVDNDKVTAKLKMLSQNGSTLTFRVMATDKTWASKESKVKVATQPKAPNVKVDITKETTSIKSGMEYKVVNAGAAANGTAWKAATDKKGLSFTDLQLGTDSRDVYVRTAASAKKLASAVTKVTINKGVDKITLPSGNKFEATGGAVANVLRVESNVEYDITKGASLYNISKEDLEWALVGADGKYKWSTLKASKDPEKKPTKVALKYSATAKANTWGADGVKLALRRSGVKQDKNGIATQSGVSATAVMALKNVAQSFAFTGGTGGETGDITTAATSATIKVATGTAVKFTVKGKVTGFVGTKAGTAKTKKVVDLPKGITYKVGKIDTNGEFDVTIDVSKLKEKVTATTAEISFEFQGIKGGFKIIVNPK